jgi:AcrR family transcriptional regulator
VPRTADHDARRRQLADAVVALVDGHGLDAVTIAGVAQQAGISVGLVQHYFPSKDELLLHAYREVMRAGRARIDRRIAEGERHRRPIRDILFDAVTEMLPLDRARRTEYRVSQSFLGRALDNPSLAAVATEHAAAVRVEVTTAIDNGKECGEVAPAVGSGRAALRLLATLDGLAARLYHEPRARVDSTAMREAVLATTREAIADVFTGDCRRHR